MKKYIGKILIILFFILSIYANFCYADGFMTDAQTWLSGAEEKASETSIDNTKTSELAGILMAVGLGIDVIGGVILGIRYMLASAQEKADLKKISMWYVIGSVIILGGVGIWSAVIKSIESVI